MQAPRTLYEKIWDSRAITEDAGETLLYVDLHLLHEVTSPQAFGGLDTANRAVRRPERTLAMVDHNVPTANQAAGIDEIEDAEARAQIRRLAENTSRHGIDLYRLGDPRNGIVHVVAPEQGRTHPGMVVVCGDSHTSTHGAFGALAFGIGTSEVEHVLATQTIRQRRSRTMRVMVQGRLASGVSAKDLALFLLQQLGVDGGLGYVIEFDGPAIRSLSMEGRMTLCNLSVEMGARAGLVAPDEVTFSYLENRPGAPSGSEWDKAVESWIALQSDAGASFDRERSFDAADIAPTVSWGTTPAQVVSIEGHIPDPAAVGDPALRRQWEQALDYMGLHAGMPIEGIPVDRVFIGSCTNSRIEDLRAAAQIVRGRKVASNLRAMVVPGSGLIRRQAEEEGLAEVFKAAGFEWREPGCSMCVGMNPDRLLPGERCAATSNRNFENRQGPGGRTHLMSPAMAAAAAVTGMITDLRKL